MASAAAGSYLLTQKSARPADVGETGGLVQGSSEIAPEVAPAPDSRREYPSREDFEVSGVRFSVVPRPQQDWARSVSATDPGEGRRWELVWVLYRNVSRERLFAEDLRFRLKNANNIVYAPVEGIGNGGSNLKPGTQIFPGTQVKAQLAFSVPADEGALWLILNPGVNTRIRVKLGSP
ncbi:MAG: hypothetical protein WKF48_11925 [Solirubrobacteraceae bacterium]